MRKLMGIWGPAIAVAVAVVLALWGVVSDIAAGAVGLAALYWYGSVWSWNYLKRMRR